ncbi:MAG TPA: hypothetical protein VFZ25_19925, partial [Chloroflexota bacterium]|nr:hypothetical protein [Chloroflexota bacterium]
MEANTPRDLASTAAGATRFSDVCGTIDELKRLLVEEPEVTATSPAVLDALIDDALAMESRMETRLREYEQFRDQIVEIAQQLPTLGDSRRPEALAVAPLLRAQLTCGRSLDLAERAEAIDRAERIRDVAQDLENKLYRYKELALALEAAYRAIKGSRIWVLDGDAGEEVTASSNEPGWARWLPPSPSRERILRYLRGG